MPFLDMPIEQLRQYQPEVKEPLDFDEFWRSTLDESRAASHPTTTTRVDSGLVLFDSYDVTFSGYLGQPVRAWLTLPRGGDTPPAAVVEYNGYGGGRGLAHERLKWTGAGYAYLLMDTRGQGSGWGSGGLTADDGPTPASGSGFMTRGITDPSQYYYRRLFTDAARAVDAVRELDLVDPRRVVVAGGSQGGGMTIAAAGLVPDVFAALPDVPFLSHFERAVGMTPSDPYAEIVRYLSVHRHASSEVFETLSYFDAANFARRAAAPALFSVALMDPVCPPSTVFAAANRWLGEATVEVYPFNEHEGGGEHHWVKQARWLRRRLDDVAAVEHTAGAPVDSLTV